MPVRPGRLGEEWRMSDKETIKLSVDTGMVVVIFICMVYMVIVFGLLFYVKNEWCDLLFKNMTVS